jgi:hypothetical protein
MVRPSLLVLTDYIGQRQEGQGNWVGIQTLVTKRRAIGYRRKTGAGTGTRRRRKSTVSFSTQPP